MIKAEVVKSLFKECLFKEEELPPKEFVAVEGISVKAGFHPERLRSCDLAVKEMLDQLPDTFRESSGGGWSFLNACVTKDGDHWAEHPTVEMLIMLGMGLGRVRCLVPRQLWSAFPGGMPYYVILNEPVPVEVVPYEPEKSEVSGEGVNV